MAPVFPARRWLASALLVCGLCVLHATGQSSGTPPATSGQATTADARMRAWRTHLDLGDASPFRPLHEDPKRPGLLYVGTDANVYVSFDRGAAWLSLCADLPTTPVMDLVVHPREDEIVIATHGRSLFLLDVRPVQALSDAVRASDLHLFDVRPVRLAWQPGREVPPLPPRGRALLHVWLKAASEVTVAIRDADDRIVRTMTARGAAGVNRLEWDAANMRFPNLPAANQYLTKDYRAGWKLV